MKKGDFVKISYTGKIKENKEVFDTTSEEVAKKNNIFNPKANYGPVLVILGHNKVVKGLDEEIQKMKVGDKKEIEVSPDKGFGKRDPKLMKLIPISEFKKQKIDPYPGLVLKMNNMSCRVISVNSGRVRVDFNHPLAGKNIVYDLKVEKKLNKEEEKVKSICEYYNYEPEKIIKNKKEIEIITKKDTDNKTKKMITNDIFDHMGFDKIKFSDIFERK